MLYFWSVIVIGSIVASIIEGFADSVGRSLSSDVYFGSKLGTVEYNKEISVIEQGIADFANAQLHIDTRKRGLLCTTFIKANGSISSTLLINIQIMEKECDWAIVIYDGDQASIGSICNDSRIVKNLIYCRRSPLSHHNRTMPNAEGNSTVKLSVPKTVFYQEIMPYIQNYERIFLMDEDISLEGFEYSTFKKVWDCGFFPRPLIVQPLIAESNQYINYLNLNSWSKGKRKDIVASAVGLVEQQVPLFDAVFFEWFVKRVLIQTRDVALQYGVDWGHDRSWCNAARLYSRMVLKRANTSVPCAVLTQGTPVHHLNQRSMAAKRENRALFHANGVQVVQHYINLFPTWVITDVLAPNNPLDYRNHRRYKKISKLNESCPM